MKTILASLCMLCAASPAMSEGIRWAGTVSPATSFRTVGPPDLRYASSTHTLGNFKTSAIPGSFNPIRRYGSLKTLDPSLAGVVFRKGYMVAFEGNGGSGAGVAGGWESAILTFTDSDSTFAYRFNETKTVADNNIDNGAAALIATGPVLVPAYAKFFGLCCSDGSALMGHIVFNLQAMGINPDDPALTVRFQAWHLADGSTGEGTPDPDAFGIVDTCPTDGVCVP